MDGGCPKIQSIGKITTMTEDATEQTPQDPRHSRQFAGHPEAEKTLLDSWNSGRLHHAWLICGPKGVGKATLAYRFARFILTGGGQGGGLFGDSPDSLDVDMDSGIVRRMNAGGHSDFMVIEKGMLNPKNNKIAENDIPVDIARKASEFVRLTPAESEWRVVIVDAIDDMNRNAANALLKVLEEPPERAVFLMVSHAPGRLLPTIRSRCRKLTLKALPEDTVIEALQNRFAELSPEECQAIARLSEGSIGKAIELADQGGLSLFQIVISLFASPGSLSLEKIHGLGETFARKEAKESYTVFRNLTGWWLERMIRALATQQHPQPIIMEETAAFDACAAQAGIAKWMDIRQNLMDLLWKTESPSNLDRRQVVVSAFLSLETALQRR